MLQHVETKVEEEISTRIKEERMPSIIYNSARGLGFRGHWGNLTTSPKPIKSYVILTLAVVISKRERYR